jgi:hypothetical protein
LLGHASPRIFRRKLPPKDRVRRTHGAYDSIDVLDTLSRLGRWIAPHLFVETRKNGRAPHQKKTLGSGGNGTAFSFSTCGRSCDDTCADIALAVVTCLV